MGLCLDYLVAFLTFFDVVLTILLNDKLFVGTLRQRPICKIAEAVVEVPD